MTQTLPSHPTPHLLLMPPIHQAHSEPEARLPTDVLMDGGGGNTDVEGRQEIPSQEELVKFRKQKSRDEDSVQSRRDTVPDSVPFFSLFRDESISLGYQLEKRHVTALNLSRSRLR